MRNIAKGLFFAAISGSCLFACADLLGLSDKSLATSNDAAIDAAHDATASSNDAPSDTGADANAPFIVAIDTFADGQNQPYGITLDDANVYWVNQGAGSLVRRNKSQGAPVVPLATSLAMPRIVVGDAVYLYFAADNSPDGDGGTEDAGALPILLGRATKEAAGDASTASVLPLFRGDNLALFSDLGLFFDRHAEAGTGTDPWLFAAENTSILRFNRDGTGGLDISDALNGVTSVAVDDAFVYFATQADSSIYRVLKDGSAAAEPLADGDVASLAIDADYIYWIDPNGALYRVDKAGATTPVVVAAGDSAASAELVVDDTFAYWTRADPDAPENGAVLLAPKNGKNATPFSVMANVNDPRGIAVDHDPVSGLPILYVTSFGDGEIERATLTANPAASPTPATTGD